MIPCVDYKYWNGFSQARLMLFFKNSRGLFGFDGNDFASRVCVANGVNQKRTGVEMFKL